VDFFRCRLMEPSLSDSVRAGAVRGDVRMTGAHFREEAERCYRLAKGPIRPETARRMTELGDHYLARARRLEADEWPACSILRAEGPAL